MGVLKVRDGPARTAQEGNHMTVSRAIELYNEGCIGAGELEQIAALQHATICYDARGRATCAGQL